MNLVQNQAEPKTDVLLKQYEQALQLIRHYDSIYTQTCLLYMALIAAYVGVFDKVTGNSILISLCLVLISICIIGTIWRLRKLIDQQRHIVSTIEEITSMKPNPQIRGLGKVRTSTYFMVIIAVITVLAVLLPFTR